MSDSLTKRFLSRFRIKPYELLGLTAFVLGITSYLHNGDGFNIDTHDVFLLVNLITIYQLFTALLFFIWSIYLIINRYLTLIIWIWLHVITTLFPIFLFLVLLSFQDHRIPRRYYAFTDFEKHKPIIDFITAVKTLLIIFSVGQLCFLINLIGGIIKRISNVKSH